MSFIHQLSEPNHAGACMSSPPRTLCIDDNVRRTYALILSGLRSARLSAGLTQEAVAADLPVRARAVCEWETGAIEPTLRNLIHWSSRLDRPLTIIGRNGELLNDPVRPRPGESWETAERRRLAAPLRNRRQALGMAQEDLGLRVGVSRDSIQRWELTRVPPRPIAHIVWARTLGYSLALQPIDIPNGNCTS